MMILQDSLHRIAQIKVVVMFSLIECIRIFSALYTFGEGATRYAESNPHKSECGNSYKLSYSLLCHSTITQQCTQSILSPPGALEDGNRRLEWGGQWRNKWEKG
jgi:hypothetical protein